MENKDRTVNISGRTAMNASDEIKRHHHIPFVTPVDDAARPPICHQNSRRPD